MDPIWQPRVLAHARGIDTQLSKGVDLDDYADTKVYVYGLEKHCDDTLWEIFKGDFENWDVESFKALSPTIRTKLRNCLLINGVYLRPQPTTISAALYALVTEPIQHEWTDDELAMNLVKYAPMHTNALRNRLNKEKTGLVTAPIPIATTLQPTSTPNPLASWGQVTGQPAGQSTSQSALPGQSVFGSINANLGQSQISQPPPNLSPPPPLPPSLPQPPLPPPLPQPPLLPPQNQPSQTLQTGSGSTNYSREIATVAKIYSEEQKYSGTGDSLDYKLQIFYDTCNRAGLPSEAYMLAFPSMLRGLAETHYFNCSLSTKPFNDACANMRGFFEGDEYYNKNLTEWNAIHLNDFIHNSVNANKSIYTCFQMLVDKLVKHQHGLRPSLRSNELLHIKLGMACQGVPACSNALSNPGNYDIANLVSRMQASIVAWEKEHSSSITQAFTSEPEITEAEILYTDRQYRGRGPGGYRGNSRYRGNQRRGDRFQRTQEPKKCFICKKPGCWSTNHTKEEQEESRRAFRAKFHARTDSRYSDQTANSRFKQYLVAHEGEGEGEGEGSGDDDILEALVLEIDSDSEWQGVNESDYQQATSYVTSYGELSTNSATYTASLLADKSFAHLIDPTNNTTEHQTDLPTTPIAYAAHARVRYGKDVFMGIIVDTGAAVKSTAGYSQFQALQQSESDLKAELDTSTKGGVTVQFGVGSATSIGTTTINTPIGEVKFHVVEVDTPFLLCLADMDKLGVYYDNTRDVLVTSTKEVPVFRRFGHAFLLSNSSLQSYLIGSFDQNPCYLTEAELRRLHRRFGHPSAKRLEKLLTRAGHDIDKKSLEYLTKYCHFCQKHGKSPGRFRFTLRDDVEFNFNIIVDIFYINSRPVLHIVDESTRFSAGKFLQNISAKHTWEVLKMCWIDTYLGPPDLITTDAGKNFVSKEFKEYTGTMGIRVKTVPVEAHNSIGMVERYHPLIRRIYQILRVELPDVNEDAILQMSFKAVNDTAGPNGLVPTLLAFGAYPRMTDRDAPAPTVAQRVKAMDKAMAEVRKVRAERQVADALAIRNGPRRTDVHDLPLNSPVLVWREGNTGQSGHWDGPFTLLSIEGETCVVKINSGPTSFRSTVVKPYFQSPNDQISDPFNEPLQPEPLQIASEVDAPATDENTSEITSVPPVLPQIPPQVPKRGRGRPRKYPLLTRLADIEVYLQYDESRQKELNGLLEKGVFELCDIDDVPDGVRLFNSRFVDEIKLQGTDKAFEKSRLVVQAYNDEEKELVLTQSPTIQRVSQRLILCIAAMGGHELYLRDISQAYVQSTTNLNRQFYVRPPKELQNQLGLNERSILKVLKPLYGVPEAGNHWFKTYHGHHVEGLGMCQSTYDPCLLYSNDPFGVVGMQTDDTLILASGEMAEREEEKLLEAKLLAKAREKLSPDFPLKFNGGLIQQLADGISLTQEQQCHNLNAISSRTSTSTGTRGVTRVLTPKDQYIAQRARGAYIASMCQPEASFDLSFAAQAVNPTEIDAKALNKRLEWQIANPKRGLKFVKLDVKTLQLVAFTDASFANLKDLSSQIGYVLVLMDGNNKANIIHWSSTKCKRVTRSVLASELYGMAHGFDIAAAVKSTVDGILQVSLPLVLATDSKSLYDCLVRLGTTQEKRLMVDVMCLRQAYERRQITEVKWIDGESNPADAMTKAKACPALTKLLDTNELDLKAIGWVERAAKAEGTNVATNEGIRRGQLGHLGGGEKGPTGWGLYAD